ncbi:AI-2E family transporter [Polymorphum gilvum]|uniref:Conserved domain protein, putative n=1 Tax=Polymorphum gilvum (strain LMG 25793 / CGMCC 1.9160 / SL003B-26A1) TaxID=991905 RepID=F2J1C1_POLGS|nr:AI-2E family transporter [Polymorphum gilvum]ADZ69703.1 Conserved domain protein, putative [Polymorphum gilvum SL003B-26A1]
MRYSLLGVTLTVALVTLVGWLLAVGRSLLLPFVTALIVWYLINALARAIRLVPIGPFQVPNALALLLALIAIFTAATFVFDLVAANLAQLARDAPTYQARLEAVFATLSTRLSLQDPIELRDFLPDAFVTRFVAAGATFVTTMAGSASLVFIYVVFLLIEQSTFDRKYRALFTSPERAQAAFALREEINRRVLHYIGIKTAVSISTGLLTTLLLTAIGLPYAALFGFIAFLLNYIPTIGSLIAVLFPSVLALVYYDEFGPFIAITLGLGAIQFAIGNLIEPRLMGSSLNLSGIVIMLSLALWGAIWGITGMVLCVPITVVIVIVCAQFPASRPIAILLSAGGDVGPPPHPYPQVPDLPGQQAQASPDALRPPQSGARVVTEPVEQEKSR